MRKTISHSRSEQCFSPKRGDTAAGEKERLFDVHYCADKDLNSSDHE